MENSKQEPTPSNKESWERRLEWLAGHPKTPEQISKDIVMALCELEKLRNILKSEDIVLALSELKKFRKFNKYKIP